MQHDDDQEQFPQHVEGAIGDWFDDMEQNISFLGREQKDHHHEKDHEKTLFPNRQNNNHYHQKTEKTPYS